MLASSLVRTRTIKSQLPLVSVCAIRKGENARRTKTDAKDRETMPALFSSCGLQVCGALKCQEKKERGARRRSQAPPLLRQRKPYLTGSPPSRRSRRYRLDVE